MQSVFLAMNIAVEVSYMTNEATSFKSHNILLAYFFESVYLFARKILPLKTYCSRVTRETNYEILKWTSDLQSARMSLIREQPF